MPTVPRLNRQAQTIGLPTPQFSGANPEAFGAGVGRGLMEVSEVFQREQEKADAVQIQSADRQLAEWELTAIHDPQQGALNRRGKDAFGLPDTLPSDFDQAAAKIAEGLSTPRQKAAFERLANARRESVLRQVNRHVSGELASYAEAENKAYLESSVSAAVANYQDPERVATESMRARNAILAHAKITGEPAELTQQRIAQAESTLHGAIVSRILDADPLAAQDYFEANKDKLTGADQAKLEKLLRPATEFEGGRQLATAAWQMRQEGRSETEVQAYLADNAKSKGQFDTAESFMRQFDQAERAEDANRRGTLLEQFSRAPNRATMNQILGSREYREMGDEARGQLSEYMRGQVRIEENRADEGRGKRYSSPEAFATFIDTLESPEFATMTRQQIYALQPKIGPQLVTKLLAEQKGMIGAAQRFQIDRDLLNEAVPEDLLKPKNKAELNAYRGIVEATLSDWKAAHPGKTPTLEEQKAIARSAQTEYVALSEGWFGGDKTLPAYKVTADMQAVPKDFVDGLRATAARRGMELTDDQILAAWARQKGAR